MIALTHLSLAGDQELVTQVPGIDLVLGGHEHENWLLRRGPEFHADRESRCERAHRRDRDADVRTMRARGRRWPRDSRCSTERIRQDPEVQAVVRKWTSIAFDAFRKSGFEPTRVVAIVTEPLDGRESVVRNQPGRLTDLITAGVRP